MACRFRCHGTTKSKNKEEELVTNIEKKNLKNEEEDEVEEPPLPPHAVHVSPRKEARRMVWGAESRTRLIEVTPQNISVYVL